MMMGTGETNAERIEHLRMIRDVQDRTGGFRAFIPWTYQPENNHLKGRTQATDLEYLRLIAVARLFFDNVAHLQSSWLTTGKDVGQLSLHMGVDDLGSIMLEENVISSAGARHRSKLTELIWLIRSADRIPAQRDTLYRHLKVHRPRPTTRPTTGWPSHFSSIALPPGPRPVPADRRRPLRPSRGDLGGTHRLFRTRSVGCRPWIMPSHTARARSFGAAADQYDRYRPTYPEEAVRWVAGDQPARVVDRGPVPAS